jgi:hypothetical protein
VGAAEALISSHTRWTARNTVFFVRRDRMSDILKRIKRAVIAGNVVFADKATTERERDGLTESDVIESILSSVAIYKTIKSTRPQARGREYLHIIHGTNLDGLVIYSKGKLVVRAGIATYYILISAKRAD